MLFAERLDQDTSGILTTICNHSFHCSCISKWADSSCPVSGSIVSLFQYMQKDVIGHSPGHGVDCAV